jgi:hypothetical protein
MRFMMIVRANKDTEAGVKPSEELLAAFMRYNEELAKAGVLLAADGPGIRLSRSSLGKDAALREQMERLKKS